MQKAGEAKATTGTPGPAPPPPPPEHPSMQKPGRVPGDSPSREGNDADDTEWWYVVILGKWGAYVTGCGSWAVANVFKTLLNLLDRLLSYSVGEPHWSNNKRFVAVIAVLVILWMLLRTANWVLTPVVWAGVSVRRLWLFLRAREGKPEDLTVHDLDWMGSGNDSSSR